MMTDLTVDHPDKTLWRLLLPMFVSVMFQQFYNIADSMIAGRFAGEDALAAVGASYAITVIFMAFAVGSNLGTSVVVSRLFGAKRIARMKSAVSTAFIACGIMALCLTLFGYFGCNAMMKAINTPENIFQDGELYLKIYVFGLIFLCLYNVCTGVFTALGDSKTPLYFLIFSSVGNIILDYIFVAHLHLGVAGVAWATFIAQGLSCILALVTLLHRLNGLKCNEKSVLFDFSLFCQIAAIAVPSILQQSVLSVGNMFVQEIVNRFGSSIIAGYSAAIKLNTFAINSFMTLGGCLSTYTAQNIGAQKGYRIPLGFKTGIKLSIIASIPFFLCYMFLPKQIMGLFLTSDSREAIQAGIQFMRIVSPMYFMISIKLMTDGILRGAGAMAFFVADTVPDLICRIFFAELFSNVLGMGSIGIWRAWPFGWTVASVLTIIFYCIVKKRSAGNTISS